MNSYRDVQPSLPNNTQQQCLNNQQHYNSKHQVANNIKQHSDTLYHQQQQQSNYIDQHQQLNRLQQPNYIDQQQQPNTLQQPSYNEQQQCNVGLDNINQLPPKNLHAYSTEGRNSDCRTIQYSKQDCVSTAHYINQDCTSPVQYYNKDCASTVQYNVQDCDSTLPYSKQDYNSSVQYISPEFETNLNKPADRQILLQADTPAGRQTQFPSLKDINYKGRNKGARQKKTLILLKLGLPPP